MRLSEAIEGHGTFWLPDDPEDKVSGTLHISRSGEVKLSLIGFLGDPVAMINRRLNRHIGFVKKEWDIMHGTVTGYGRVTLYQCWDTGGVTVGGINTSKVYANYAFLGWHFNQPSEIVFDEMFITIAGLEQWLGISGVSVTHRNDYSDFSIHADTPDEISINPSSENTLVFRFDFADSSIKPLGFEAAIRQRAYISYTENHPMQLEHATKTATRIRDFLCYATDRKLPITSITAHSAEAITTSNNGQSYPRLIKMFYRSGNHDAPERSINPHSMLSTYHDVADQLEAIIEGWFKLIENAGTPIILYFAAANNTSDYLEANFLTMTRAIETIHRSLLDHDELPEDVYVTRLNSILTQFDPETDTHNWLEEKLRWANQLAFAKRIKELISPFKSHFGNNRQRNKLVRLTVKTRNQLTHRGDSDLDSQGEYETIWILALKLEVLFKLTLLQSMGFETDLIETIIARNSTIQEVLNRSLKSSTNS